MPFSKRPKGERHITTIRWQRRQMAQMEAIIIDLREKLNRSVALMCEAQDRANKFETEADFLEEQLCEARSRLDIAIDIARHKEYRLAFLEGYYERSSEAKPEADKRDPLYPSAREEIRRRTGAQEGELWSAQPAGGEIWRVGEDDKIHHQSGAIRGAGYDQNVAEAEDFQIGEARDAKAEPRRTDGADRSSDLPF